VGDGEECRVEIVRGRRRDERLRQLRDPAYEVRPALGIELAEHVVEQQQRGVAVERDQQIELGQLEREDRRALLAARGETGQVATGELEREVVAMRADDRRPVPDLLLGRLDQPSSECVAWPLPGKGRGVGDVSRGQASGCRLVRRDLAMRGSERIGEGVEQAQARLDDPTPSVEERLVPEPQLLARRLLLADRAEEAVPLLERAAIRGQVVCVRRRAGGGKGVDGGPPELR
jgi:hypothetical protein